MSFVARLAVRRATRLSPSFVRVALGGADLRRLTIAGPTYDRRIGLVLPGPGGALPRLGDATWWQDFRALPAATRGHMRTYTLRAVEGTGDARTIVVDFVLHPGAAGPGSAWADGARAGDELLAILPDEAELGSGIEWPAQRTERILLAGDETAVPAICSILAALPAHARGAALLEVPDAGDRRPLEAPAGVGVAWLARDGAPVGTLLAPRVLDALGGRDRAPAPSSAAPSDEELWETPTYSSAGEPVQGTPAADGERYVWIAGETGAVGALRRALTGLGVARSQMSCMGYWRLGHAMGH